MMAVTIDGKEATFIPETKLAFKESQVVYLGSEFDVSAVVTIDGHEQRVIQGVSDDPGLWRLFNEFASSTPEEFKALVEAS